MTIFSIIEREITDYFDREVRIQDGYMFSQPKLIKRLIYYMNGVYPSGKLDSQGNYKYWFDIITPRVDAEIKNIDFDTKDIMVYSEPKKDFLANFIANASIVEWMRERGMDTEINEAVEEGTSWGNVVWKKVPNGDKKFTRLELANVYVLNQKCRNLKKGTVIEKHSYTQEELREKKGIWNNIEAVVANCPNRMIFDQAVREPASNPIYEIFERNGEISEEAFNEAKGLKGGDPKKYFQAKVIVAGLNGSLKDGKYALYCEKLSQEERRELYKEYHRGRYNGRWMRVGLYELLFDIQTRANEIGNQIARGLEWSSKTIFRSSDRQIAQNILTDLKNGDIIKSIDLAQVPTRMQGIDQLIADWNRLMEMADKLANSTEVVMGGNMPSGTPFRLGALLNTNARKLFDFIQKKLGMVIEDLLYDWVLPDLLKDLKAKRVLELTGDSEYLKQWYEMLVDSWYLRNLLYLPPHTAEQGLALKTVKMQELSQKEQARIDLEKDIFKDYKPRMRVVITGENVRLASDLETLSTFIQLEADPVRRTALIEIAMGKKGINIKDLPKSPPAPMDTPQGSLKGQTPAIPATMGGGAT